MDWDFPPNFGAPPTPTPEIVEGPDGGRIYLLLSSNGTTAIEVIQVATGDTVAVFPVTSVTTATALAFVPSPEGYLVADAARTGLAVLDATGAETNLLPTWAPPVDVEYAPILERTFVVTSSAMFALRAGNEVVNACWLDAERGTAIAVKEEMVRLTGDDDDDDGQSSWFVQSELAVTASGPAGGVVYRESWIADAFDEEYFSCGYVALPEDSCVPQPDAVELRGVDHPRVFAGDSACDRIFHHDFGTPIAADLGPGAAPASRASPNRLLWSEERDALVVAEASSLFLVGSAGAPVEEIPGFDRATAVAGSIGGRAIWVGSAAADSASSPVLYRYTTGAPVSRAAGFAGSSIVDVDYVDRPPVFPDVWAFTGTLVASAHRGQVGYYRVNAFDPDDDAVVISAVEPLPDGMRFDEDTHAFTWVLPCEASPDDWIVRVTATAGRYRSPIDLFVWFSDDDESPPCEVSGSHVPATW